MAAAMLLAFAASADLRTPTPPGWYDPDGVAAGQDWHYRVPISLPATSTVNSTAKANINFTTLMTQLGISGTFDINSIRVVRPNGTLSTIQEFNDTIFNNATDAAANGRGEIKWIVEDGGAQTYFVYFDISQNGAKSVNPQTPINGNFERGTAGTLSPSQWTASRTNTLFDAQVRPSESVSVTDSAGGNQTVTTDGTPRSGAFSYLLGARTANEPANGVGTSLTRTIAVPATNPGDITISYRVEGWDSSANASASWDWIDIDLVGSTTSRLVGPTAGNYVGYPFSPNLGTGAATATASGYGQYNGWDTNTAGAHTSTMTIARGSQPWFTRTFSLTAYAGQTITLQIKSNHSTSYRTWFHIDDVEWSVVNGTVGTPEAFGVVTTMPAAGATYAPGQALTITAQVDAKPTAATNPVTANVYDQSGTIVASGIILYNDGTHGDVTAGDAIWTNNNSVVAQPTFTIPLTAPTSSGWTVRVFAKDASSSTVGAQNGLAKRNGLPVSEIEANYWNIDETLFSVARADISIGKFSAVLSDPVNGTTNAKAIPGATVRYCILISNAGSATAESLIANDPLPPNLTYISGSMRSGATCLTTNMIEDDDSIGADESDPDGASYNSGAISITGTTLAANSAFAVTYEVTVK